MKVGAQIGILSDKEDIRASLKELEGTSLRGIEVFTKHVSPYYETPERFNQLLQTAGIDLAGLYWGHDRVREPAAADEVVADSLRLAKFLSQTGGGFLVVHGGAPRKEDTIFLEADFAHFAGLLNRIGEACRDMKIPVVLHPHFACMVETTKDVDMLLNHGLNRDLVGLCVHAAHQVLKGVDPYLMYEKYASWVRYVHIGGINKEKDGVLVGENSDLDQSRLMQPILNAGFDGWVIVESKKKDIPPPDYCRKTVEFLQQHWPEIKWA